MFLSRFFKPNIKKLLKKRDVDGLFNALTHKDYKIRYKSIDALSSIYKELDDDKKFNFLIYLFKGLNDSEECVAHKSLDSIGKIDLNIRDIIVSLNNNQKIKTFLSRESNETIHFLGNDLNIKFTSFSRESSDFNSFSNMAELYSANGENDKAFLYFKKSLIISLVVFGEYSEETADLYHKIANAYLNENNIAIALDYYEKELRILKEIYNDYHPFVKNLRSIIDSYN